jgi:hypothetical protein
MRPLICLALLALLAACGGRKEATTISVNCSDGVQLVGAVSVDLLGDLADGRPAMKYPDPANAGRTGTITIQPHQHCTIMPTAKID